MSPSTTTSRRSRQSNTQGQLLFAGDHRANPSHAPGSDWARKTTASSGKRLFPSFSESDPLGAYSKTLLGSEQWASMEFLLNWRIITTPQGRSVFQLAPSAPRTGESDTGLFAAGWGTPNCMDEIGPRSQEALARAKKKAGCCNIKDQLPQVWPTTSQGDWKSPTPNPERMDYIPNILKANWPTPRKCNEMDCQTNEKAVLHNLENKGYKSRLEQNAAGLGQITSGCLARTESFVVRLTTLSAWLMGYTAAYLALWETASSRKSRKGSSAP